MNVGEKKSRYLILFSMKKGWALVLLLTRFKCMIFFKWYPHCFVIFGGQGITIFAEVLRKRGQVIRFIKIC